MIDNLTLQVNDLKNKNDQKTREIDKLKEEIKKREKGFEDKLNLANSKHTTIEISLCR
jgi:peptidoglycan hydrolase CwlO-like protein